jgi:hypothetical protein
LPVDFDKIMVYYIFSLLNKKTRRCRERQVTTQKG